MTNPTELGNTLEEIVRRLRRSTLYRRFFARAFGSEEVSIERVAAAIATFERTLLCGDSPFDRFERSGDPRELSAAARRGFELFRGKARCSLCHGGPLFTDERFHNTGVSWGREPLDLGRHEITGRAQDKGKFRTQSLRNLVHTAPYMHDGSLTSLADVVDFYDQGGRPNPFQDGSLRPLHLSVRDRADLVAFLESLEGRRPPNHDLYPSEPIRPSKREKEPRP